MQGVNIKGNFAGNGTVTLSCGGYAPSGLGLIMTISKNNYKEFKQLIKDENLDIFEIGKIEVNKSSRCTIS